MKAPLEAVALEYGHLKTPKVVAKGQSELALRIINEAKKQGIYVAEDPQLLALLSKLDVGDEITQDMYTAVAVILSWVYWLKGMQPGDEKKAMGGENQAEDRQASVKPLIAAQAFDLTQAVVDLHGAGGVVHIQALQGATDGVEFAHDQNFIATVHVAAGHHAGCEIHSSARPICRHLQAGERR